MARQDLQLQGVKQLGHQMPRFIFGLMITTVA